MTERAVRLLRRDLLDREQQKRRELRAVIKVLAQAIEQAGGPTAAQTRAAIKAELAEHDEGL